MFTMQVCGSSFACLLLVFTPLFTEGVRLSEVGEYDLVVNVDPNTYHGEPGVYLEQIKKTFLRLSDEMKRSTGIFSIKSVNVIIPRGWDIPSDICTESNNGDYTAGDIRVSPNVQAPSVENPTLCGLPGEFIQVPPDFFEFEAGQDAPWRQLLSLWARFRWGVWEEYGDPEDEQFPYAYYPDFDEKDPKLTGCSDETIRGEFFNGANRCNPVEDNNCRFSPSLYQNATTSLMNYHWLDSTEYFCNAFNHDQRAPNKQNLFCNYRSTVEVIRSCPDFRAVVDTKSVVSELKFSCTKHVASPVLYLLVDRSTYSWDIPFSPDDVLESVLLKMEAQLPKDLIAGMNTYPPYSDLKSGQKILPRLYDREFFLLTIPIARVVVPYIDFGQAIIDTTEMIRQTSRETGGVILVVKGHQLMQSTGHHDYIYYWKYYPIIWEWKFYLEALALESRVQFALEESNTRLFALEIAPPAEAVPLHLEYLAGISSGMTLQITSGREIDEKVEMIFDRLREIYDQSGHLAEQRLEPIVAWEGHVEQEHLYEFPVISPITKIRLDLTTIQDNLPLKHKSTYLRINEEEVKDFVFTKRSQFALEDRNFPHVYSFTYNLENPEPATTIKFHFFSNMPEVPCYLQITAYNESFPELNIVLSTSALNNVVNYEQLPLAVTPFAIYAHVSSPKGGKQIPNVQVRARIVGKGTNYRTNTTIVLKDNGRFPDLRANDGIFSVNFFPELATSERFPSAFLWAWTTGILSADFLRTLKYYSYECQSVNFLPRTISYVLEVSAEIMQECSASFDEVSARNSGQITEECYPRHYNKTVRLPGYISLENTNGFVAVATAIRDLEVTSSDGGKILRFTLTSSRILRLDKVNQVVVNYNIVRSKYAETLYNLETENFSPKNLPDGVVLELTDGADDLDARFIIWQRNPRENGSFYYGVVVTVDGTLAKPSTMSNIVKHTVEIPFAPTTTSGPESTTKTEFTTRETTHKSGITRSTSSDNPTGDYSTKASSTNSFSLETDGSTDGISSLVSTSGSTSEPPVLEEDDRPWIQTTGGIVTVILVSCVAVLIVLNGWCVYRRRRWLVKKKSAASHVEPPQPEFSQHI